jgi:hypothetical protein
MLWISFPGRGRLDIKTKVLSRHLTEQDLLAKTATANFPFTRNCHPCRNPETIVTARGGTSLNFLSSGRARDLKLQKLESSLLKFGTL